MQYHDRNVEKPAIYNLQLMVEDPRFEGFSFVRSRSLMRRSGDMLDDFFLERTDIRGRYKARSIAHAWTPQKVRGRVRDFNDYPCVDLFVPAFSSRAVDRLRDLLEPNGELLPLNSNPPGYMAYNVTNVQDVLDVKKSRIDWISGGIFTDVEHFVLKESVDIDCLSIFKFPQLHIKVFVNQVFVDRVRSAGLRGFQFTKVWPFPPEVSWRKQAAERRKKNSALKELTAESLVVGVDFGNTEKDKLAKAKQIISDWMDQVDKKLMRIEAEAAYCGTLAGHEYKEIDGQLRCLLFLSCPDSKKLAAALSTELSQLKKEFSVIANRRLGTIYDADAKEIPLKIT